MNMLAGKKVYAFGDSIVYGHTMPEKSFLKIMEQEDGICLTMCAVNGATVIEGENDILTQVKKAPEERPDFVVLNGYTNDAYERNMTKLGVVKGMEAGEWDTATFCGGFEAIFAEMRRKWGNVPIVYVAIHKSGSRDWNVQCSMRKLALEICGLWGVKVADIFKDTELDTRNPQEMAAYIIDGEGSHPNEAACRKYYIPVVKETLEHI